MSKFPPSQWAGTSGRYLALWILEIVFDLFRLRMIRVVVVGGLRLLRVLEPILRNRSGRNLRVKLTMLKFKFVGNYDLTYMALKYLRTQDHT
jgi:hypothetical protein